jgi:hypothetical protein
VANLKNLYMDYYYDKNNKFDEFIGLLDCFQTPLYFILKQKVEGIHKPYEIFLQDTTFDLSHKLDGSRINLDLSDYPSYPDVFDIKRIDGKGMETLKEIQSLLDQGEIVIYNTFLSRVPSYAYYISKDCPFNPKEDMYGHVLVALAMKDEMLYYLEAPGMLNKSNFTPFNGSTTIGMTPVRELKEAMDCYLSYYKVKVKNYRFTDEYQEEKLINTIKKITANFYKGSSIEQERKYYYNNEALATVIQYMKEGIISLGNKNDDNTVDYSNLLNWKMETIRQKKVVLIECMKKYPSTSKQEDIAVLQKNANLWQFIISILSLKNHSNKVVNSDEFIKYIGKLIESEEKVYFQLCELLQRVQNNYDLIKSD